MQKYLEALSFRHCELNQFFSIVNWIEPTRTDLRVRFTYLKNMEKFVPNKVPLTSKPIDLIVL